MTRLSTRLLGAGAVLGGLHLAVALPSFVVQARRGRGGSRFPGVDSFAVVTDRLWRGAAPADDGYRALAAAGVRTVIDLRAEADSEAVVRAASKHGMQSLHLPIRDGQVPTPEQLAHFAEVVESGDELVFVHCGAGVGRTGTVVAAYAVTTGAPPWEQLARALSFGPLSLEQQLFIIAGGERRAPAWPIVTGVSRVIDSPRRLLARLRRRTGWGVLYRAG